MSTYTLHLTGDAPMPVFETDDETAMADEVRRRWPDSVAMPDITTPTPTLWIWTGWQSFIDTCATAMGMDASQPLITDHACAAVIGRQPLPGVSPFTPTLWLSPKMAEAIEARIRQLGGADSN